MTRSGASAKSEREEECSRADEVKLKRKMAVQYYQYSGKASMRAALLLQCWLAVEQTPGWKLEMSNGKVGVRPASESNPGRVHTNDGEGIASSTDEMGRGRSHPRTLAGGPPASAKWARFMDLIAKEDDGVGEDDNKIKKFCEDTTDCLKKLGGSKQDEDWEEKTRRECRTADERDISNTGAADDTVPSKSHEDGFDVYLEWRNEQNKIIREKLGKPGYVGQAILQDALSSDPNAPKRLNEIRQRVSDLLEEKYDAYYQKVAEQHKQRKQNITTKNKLG
ncbi:unnamed protein product [Amoebophrya sp. A120]|nr:unnamed protein product [Amoebophrya sp. A120]|eukprot:GSA120T00004682001.1